MLQWFIRFHRILPMYLHKEKTRLLLSLSKGKTEKHGVTLNQNSSLFCSSCGGYILCIYVEKI